MTDLRAQVVEAMAQAMQYADDNTPTEVGWETFDAHAEAALDAALDVLGELRDDWNALAIERGGYPSVVVPDAKYLLAVLQMEMGSE